MPSLADLLPGAVAVFEGMEARARAFFEEMRPKVAAAPLPIVCERHLEVR